MAAYDIAPQQFTPTKTDEQGSTEPSPASVTPPVIAAAATAADKPHNPTQHNRQHRQQTATPSSKSASSPEDSTKDTSNESDNDENGDEESGGEGEEAGAGGEAGDLLMDEEEGDEVAGRRSHPIPISDVSRKHPLWCRWTLWFDGTTKKSTSKNWSDSVKEVMSFDAVEDFWTLYNGIHSPSSLPRGCNYHLFKHAIKPMWEHEANKHGGKWVVVFTANSKGKIDMAWLYTSLAMIGETFTPGADVCGAVVSMRLNAHKISLWTRTTEKASCIALGQQFRNALDRVGLPRRRMDFQAHADSLQNDSSFGNRAIYTLD